MLSVQELVKSWKIDWTDFCVSAVYQLLLEDGQWLAGWLDESVDGWLDESVDGRTHKWICES